MGNAVAEVMARIDTLERELVQLKALAGSLRMADSEGRTAAQPEATPPASRRDLLRYGALALGAAAAAAANGTPPVEAADGGPVVIGSDNFGTGTTSLTTSGEEAIALSATATGPEGIGLLGFSSSGTGVYGATNSTSRPAVFGSSSAPSGLAPGVWGLADAPGAPGVLGTAAHGGNAVRAEVPAYSASNAIAMYALNYSTFTGAAPGAGGFAIYGLCARGHGLVGATASPGAAAVVGASNSVGGAYAGAFYGPVIVSGNFTVVGGAKSAAVPHPDGTHRRLYCVESPESWFEDYGKAKLVCGEAVVKLDRDFTAFVETADYHVFLTGYDGLSDVSVCDTNADGFRVKAKSGTDDGTFSWRVVAKRKDIAGPRFETVEIPKAPTLPPVPASATATDSRPMPLMRGRSKSKG